MALVVVLALLVITFMVLQIMPLVIIGLFLLAFAAFNLIEKGQVD